MGGLSLVVGLSGAVLMASSAGWPGQDVGEAPAPAETRCQARFGRSVVTVSARTVPAPVAAEAVGGGIGGAAQSTWNAVSGTYLL